MSAQLTAVETLSDSLFACAYAWAHGSQYNRTDLDKALHQHKDPTTKYGKLVVALKRISSMTYEDMCEAGYLGKDNDRVITLRRSVLAESVGEKEVNSWLRDIKRIQRVFPESAIHAQNTRLPLSRGSEGFNARQDYVIKHFLPAQSLCSIYGPSGSYKSFLAVSWACHIASGISWSGKRVTPGAVLYIVGEGGVGVPRRIRAWEQDHGRTVDNLWLVNRPVFPVRESEVIEVIKAAKQIEGECGFPVSLVVIDTLARCFGGNDENDARDMGAFIEGCDTIKQKTGATVLVVHHSGKDEAKGARGSSSFRAALDAEFNVKREGEAKALILSCTKMKDAEEPERRAYDLKPVELYVDEDGEAIGSLVLRDMSREPNEVDPELIGVDKLSDNHMALWQAIRSRKASGEPCNRAIVRDDLKALGLNVKHFTRWLQKLIDDGLVLQDGDLLACQPAREVGE
ncbi:TPA: helicase RepA family protein [Raoultella terrigena]